MPDLSSLPHQLDAKKCTCRAVIETPKGSRNKFKYDQDSGLFMLGGLLPAGMMFPFDFGFVPSTLGEDGDPLVLPEQALMVSRIVDAIYESDESGQSVDLRAKRGSRKK